MGKKKDIKDSEKSKIVDLLSEGTSTLEISRVLGRDHRTIKRVVKDVSKSRVRTKGKGFKNVTQRDLRKLKQTLVKNPLLTSKEIFHQAGMEEVRRDKRCRMLKTLGKVKKASSRPPLNQLHIQKRLAWAKENLKTDFSKVIFTDESRVTLDGPDGWSKGWVIAGENSPTRLRRQQGGGGIMIWAGIVGDKVIGPFKLDQGVKLNTESYRQLLDHTFFQWYNKQSRAFKSKCIFMQDNAPSHASKGTRAHLAKKGLKESKLMTWPSSSPDLNPIENLWGIAKKEVYKAGKQYSSLADLWVAIQAAVESIPPQTISRLTSSMDQRLLKLVENKGGYINM